MNNEYVRIEKAMEITHLSKHYIYQLVHLRQIPFVKYGAKTLLFEPNKLRDWRDSRMKKFDVMSDTP